MRFETGKYYKHTNGNTIAIRGIVYTYTHDIVGVAETSQGYAKFVGLTDANTVGFQEITVDDWNKK